MDSERIMETAVLALSKKKGREIKAVRISDITTLAEYFVFATATSSTHVRALADEVEDTLQAAGVQPHHIEGKTTGWILLDYNGVVVHIFTRDNREFYDLDRMWSDGEEIDLSALLDEEGESAK